MEQITMLSGSEIIHHKLSGPRELPTCGWKEFSPSNSWLERKQIQTSLEDKEAIIGLERIEKQTNLARAEWIHERNKARVLKKVGKYWEVVGHHQDDEDWLYPEEALYLIEVNVLELYLDGVPVSVEHAYALLLGVSRACTLQEYRVYSYLSRRGYKLIRHAQDVTVTRYEKQIHLDKVLESQKRNIPNVYNEPNREMIVNSEISETNVDQESKRTIPNDLEGTNDLSNNSNESSKSIAKETSKRNSDSEDIYLVEDNIEIIEIDDSIKKISKSTSLSEQSIQKPIKDIKKEDIIVIDDDDESNSQEQIKKEKVIEQQEDSSEEESDDDVILIKSVRIESRPWYKPLKKCLVATEVQLVDLCNDNIPELKIERDDYKNPCLDLIKNKNIHNILDEMINASSGVSIIKAPNSMLLPKEIVPKHSEYKVNLNVRQQSNNYSRLSMHPVRRQFYNNNHSNNYFNGQRNNMFGNNVLKQACEMRAMAITMMQVASSLMTAVNNTQVASSINQTPLVSDSQYQNIYNTVQYQNNYTPRHFNNGGMYNHNLYSNKSFHNQRNNNSFFPRNGGHRRNFRIRAHRNNNTRTNIPNQQNIRGRHRFFNRIALTSEIVNIDSDDDSASQYKRKRSDIAKTSSKKVKPAQSVEVIDLCDDVSSVKSEPSECEMEIEEKKFFIVEEGNSSENRPDGEHNFNTKNKSNDVIVVGKDVEVGQLLLSHLHTKKEPEDIAENVVTDNKKQKGSKNKQCETKKNDELNFQRQIDENDSTAIEETSEKDKVLKDMTCSSPCSIELESIESPETAQETGSSNKGNEGTTYNTVSQEQEELPSEFEPTSWQEYKEQSEQIGMSEDNLLSKNEQIESLVLPDQCADTAEILSNLQIFSSIDEVDHDGTKLIKISFDVYLPTDHFKKTVKVLPKFRIIVVNSTDPLPAKNDIDFLKTTYQDGIPFVYAVVYNETITFYFYDSVSLPDYCD